MVRIYECLTPFPSLSNVRQPLVVALRIVICFTCCLRVVTGLWPPPAIMSHVIDVALALFMPTICLYSA
ncbi:hypothetical protein BX600DRAFT_474203 [Xylariales sp. PMI_506]|nr:hypothetical protein BX600DRAFT_474203 [Xylariales sp. PMI_506]